MTTKRSESAGAKQPTLDEFKALMEASTPGPWFVERGGELRDRHGSLVMADMAPEAGIFNNENDAAFIAASREMVPLLIAVAEAVKACRANAVDSDDTGTWYEIREEEWNAVERALSALSPASEVTP